MNKKSIYTVLLVLTLMLSACGSNEIEDGATTNTSGSSTENTSSTPTVSTQTGAFKINVLDSQVDINESGVEKPIRIRVTQSNIGSKNKKISISSLVSQGSFLSTTATSDDAGDTVFTYKAPATINDNSFTVNFCLVDDSSICDSAKITLTKGVIIPPVDVVDDINYFLTFVPNGGLYNMSLDSRNNAVVTLIDKDTNQPIDASQIKSISIVSKDASVLKITPEGGGIPSGSINFDAGRNGVSVLMTSDKINSGLAPIEVVVEYLNKNGRLQTRGQLFSIAVGSGSPTAFSFNDNGVSYNFDTKQFEHKFLVQATDASGNPVSTTGTINVSAMASFAKDAAGREMLYGRHSAGVSATVSPSNGKAILELQGLAPFNAAQIKRNRAFVAVFGDVETYEANGKWNIDNITSANSLSLGNIYNGEAHAGLGMAIGYNFRNKICTSAYEESVVVVDSTDGTYQLDATGKAVVTLKYDPYMIGKRVMIMVNMVGLDPNTKQITRMGEVKARTLSFTEPLKGDTIKVPKGASNVIVGIYGVIQTGSADEWALRNSTFSCELDLSKVNIVSGPTKNNPAGCEDGGKAFLSYEVSSAGEDGTVTFKNCQVDAEPDF